MADNTPYSGGIYGNDGDTVSIPAYKPTTQTLYEWGGTVTQIGQSIGTYYKPTGNSTTLTKVGTRHSTTTLYRLGDYVTMYNKGASYYLAASDTGQNALRGGLYSSSPFFETSAGSYKCAKRSNTPVYYSGAVYVNTLWDRSVSKFNIVGNGESFYKAGDAERCIITDNQLYEAGDSVSVPEYARQSTMAYTAGTSVTVAKSTTKTFYERDEVSDTTVQKRGSRLGLNPATGTITEVNVVKA